MAVVGLRAAMIWPLMGMSVTLPSASCVWDFRPFVRSKRVSVSSFCRVPEMARN